MSLLGHATNAGLQGPYTLADIVIDGNVPVRSPGVYALGRMGSGKIFYIHYVGRSDTDVNHRLKQHIGKYLQFKFKCYGSAKAAFEKECYLYHEFDPSRLDNEIHPASREGWQCPRCRSLYG